MALTHTERTYKVWFKKATGIELAREDGLTDEQLAIARAKKASYERDCRRDKRIAKREEELREMGKL